MSSSQKSLKITGGFLLVESRGLSVPFSNFTFPDLPPKFQTWWLHPPEETKPLALLPKCSFSSISFPSFLFNFNWLQLSLNPLLFSTPVCSQLWKVWAQLCVLIPWKPVSCLYSWAALTCSSTSRPEAALCETHWDVSQLTTLRTKLTPIFTSELLLTNVPILVSTLPSSQTGILESHCNSSHSL